MTIIKVLAAAGTILAAGAGARIAGAADFNIEPGGKNFVRFESKAPMETVTGTTQQVHGSLAFDPASLGDTIAVTVAVDLATLDTGIALRNRHMRENHLHTDKYPQAVFHGARILESSAPGLGQGKTTKLRVRGILAMHGVEKVVEAPVEADLLPDGSVHALVRFDVKLADYEIPRPQFLVMRLDEVQHLTLDLTARPGAAP